MLDVFTSTGYVIEGRKFSSRDAAARFLTSTNDMEPKEADSYLSMLVRAYRQRIRTGQPRAVLGQREGV